LGEWHSIRRGGGGGGGNAGYEEFEMPSEHIKENLAFEDETLRGFNKQVSLDTLPEPERPPLRHIDTYCMPECPCLSKRYTIALLACMGKDKTFYAPFAYSLGSSLALFHA
jgi:hypothetical protein